MTSTAYPNTPVGTDRRSIASINGNIDFFQGLINQGLFDENNVLDLAFGSDQLKPQVASGFLAASTAWTPVIYPGQETRLTMAQFSVASACLILAAFTSTYVPQSTGDAYGWLTLYANNTVFGDGNMIATGIMKPQVPLQALGAYAAAPGTYTIACGLSNNGDIGFPNTMGYGYSWAAMSFGVKQL